MISIERYIHFALLSWAYWTGQKELVTEINQKGANYLKDHPSEISDLFLKLISGLYFPVSADVPCSTNFFNQTWNDTIYRAISRKLNVPLKPFWPHERPFALILSHDIDRIKQTYQSVWEHFRRHDFLNGIVSLIRGLPISKTVHNPDPYRNLTRILLQERRWGIKSVLFVLNEKRRIRQLLKLRPQHVLGVYDPKEILEDIQSLLEQGHELGLHVSLEGIRSRKPLLREKAYIESLWGLRLEGARTHYLLFSEKTPALLMEEGFTYDSSLGFNFHSGFRCGTAFPFLLGQFNEGLLWEIPFQVMDTALRWQVKRTGGQEDMDRILSLILEHVMEGQGLLVINWHQRNFNRSQYPELFELMEGLILKAKREGAWLTTPKELIPWWHQERPEQ